MDNQDLRKAGLKVTLPRMKILQQLECALCRSQVLETRVQELDRFVLDLFHLGLETCEVRVTSSLEALLEHMLDRLEATGQPPHPLDQVVNASGVTRHLASIASSRLYGSQSLQKKRSSNPMLR